ncbi:hypothetical protein GCM10010344_00560 [Streptomyces bluensis]|nr:hypothetical protein GCM10010344_00560 [Streptomyces bluensis]
MAIRALRYGPYGIVAGDLNQPPADPAHPSPDYAAMPPSPPCPGSRFELAGQCGHADRGGHTQHLGAKDLLGQTGRWVDREQSASAADGSDRS